MNANFEKLCRRTGAYSLPWLIRLSNYDYSENQYFVNDVADVEYLGTTYAASTFNYQPDAMIHGFNGGGNFEISVIGNYVIDIVDRNKNLRLDVIAVILEDGTISEVKKFRNSYGSISGDRAKITFTFDKDDRLEMKFPALVFSHYNNRGN